MIKTLTNLNFVSFNQFLNSNKQEDLLIGSIQIKLSNAITTYEIEYINFVIILSKLGGLFSFLKFVCLAVIHLFNFRENCSVF